MFIKNLFSKFNKEKLLINKDLQLLIKQFEYMEKENAILLEEVKMLKKLLFGIKSDFKRKKKK